MHPSHHEATVWIPDLLIPLPPALSRAIDRAVDGRLDGPILCNTLGGRMDRHAATRRLKHLAATAGIRMPRMHPLSRPRGAVSVLPLVRFPGPLAEPTVPISRQRARPACYDSENPGGRPCACLVVRLLPGRGPGTWKGRNKPSREDRRWVTAWSPEQISHQLRVDFPDDESMRISHEAIYQALFIQGEVH